jgi:hypothetical protein
VVARELEAHFFSRSKTAASTGTISSNAVALAFALREAPFWEEVDSARCGQRNSSSVLTLTTGILARM